MGCGTGVVSRRVASRVGASGPTVGIDLNENILAEAARHVPAGLVIAPHNQFVTDTRGRPISSSGVQQWFDLDQAYIREYGL